MLNPHNHSLAADIAEAIERDNYAEVLQCARVAPDVLTLRTDNGNMPLLHSAICAGKPQAVKALLKAGADPEATGGPSAYTALHFAVYKHDLDMATILVNHGVDINRGTPKTPLHLAVYFGAEDLVDLLLQSGANPKMGEKLLELAIQRMHDLPEHATSYHRILKKLDLWRKDPTEKVTKDLQRIKTKNYALPAEARQVTL